MQIQCAIMAQEAPMTNKEYALSRLRGAESDIASIELTLDSIKHAIQEAREYLELPDEPETRT